MKLFFNIRIRSLDICVCVALIFVFIQDEPSWSGSRLGVRIGLALLLGTEAFYHDLTRIFM